jgi:hypothetical protein
MSFWEKTKAFLNDFFSEEPLPRPGEPIEYEGKTYTPWDPEQDEWRQWPNYTCPICNGLSLKRDMYFNKETQVLYHKACIEKKKSGG